MTTVVAKERIKENMGDGALVSLDPQNGEVLAMIGSWNYNDPYFGSDNYAASRTAEHGVDHQALHLHGSHRVDEIHDDNADPGRLLRVPDTGQRVRTSRSTMTAASTASASSSHVSGTP